MAGWGFGEWGFSPWSGSPSVGTLCAPVGPQLNLLIRSPGPGERDVAPDRIVKLAFYDSTLNIDPSTLYVTINGQAAVSGTLFLNGFSGSVAIVSDVLTVQILNPVGWAYDSTFETFAHLKNFAGECFEDTWRWHTGTDTVCYTGLSPLEIEQALIQPLNFFLEAEFLRSFLLQHILRIRNTPILNSESKAARAIYQTAFSTELSTIQNLYVPRNEKALATIVCERERLIIVDAALANYHDLIKKMITSLTNKGVVTREHTAAFFDYLDSTNYNFRVSLVCNLVILAKALELRNLT